MDKIVATLLPLIPSDGYNLTMKYRALYYQFPTWYRLIDLTQDFSFVIKKNNSETTYQVKGVKFQEIAGNGFLIEPTREKQLEFKIENGTGFLSIHSFAKSAIKRGGQDFKDFIHDIFVELKKNKIKNLIVDLRDNTGGSDANAAYFASYFFDTPFQYWDRIEVTEPIAKEIKGVAKVFYRKPLKQDSIWLWQKGRHARDFDFYETQQPAKNNFKGRAYILINGFCMSSCADVAAILSYNSKAIFIGQETGGGYQGNTSGMMPGTTVEPFNFRLSVPLQKYVNAVDPVKNIGRGTIPDHIINPTIWEIIEGKDAELGFAIEQVKKSAD
jgi:hypothetical protein